MMIIAQTSRLGTLLFMILNELVSYIDHKLYFFACASSAAQKIKKLSETPATVPIVAKLCMFDSKNRKIAEKLVQPVTPHLGCFQWGLQWRNS